MTRDEYFENLIKRLTDIYGDFETTVIEKIARHLARTDLNSSEWEAEKSMHLAAITAAVSAALAAANKKGKYEGVNIIKKAGKRVLEDNAVIYAKSLKMDGNALKISTPTFTQSTKTLTEAGYKRVVDIINLTGSRALTSCQNLYYTASNRAYLAVKNGVASPESAIRESVIMLARNGVSVASYPTRVDRIDTAVRRNVYTALNQYSVDLTITDAKDKGLNLIETSRHFGSRPSHAPWQGRRFMLVGSSPEYPNFYEATNYGSPEGLGGPNCRHHAWLVADPSAPEAEPYDEEENRRQYEESQRQRYIERKIKDWKREASALKAAGFDTSRENVKVKQWQAVMRQFIEATGRTRRRYREQIYF